jgi:uncharacterized protein YdeI (YjbR/CyaY-like superfamily)
MQAPGYAQIEAAKADGRWARAYDGARTSAVPEDLMAALEAEPSAKAFFATIDAANRYAVLWRIQTATKAETRAKRIAHNRRSWPQSSESSSTRARPGPTCPLAGVPAQDQRQTILRVLAMV